MFLMFKGGVLPGPMTEGDIEVSKILIDLWTSFAVKGSVYISHLILLKAFSI